jgi:hypothetical protein
METANPARHPGLKPARTRKTTTAKTGNRPGDQLSALIAESGLIEVRERQNPTRPGAVARQVLTPGFRHAQLHALPPVAA